jgi:tRNA(Arg) A34 adenosine deaminase TadA
MGIADKGLSGAWDVALRLAWDAARARTTPVGAVVVDGAGVIIATGRGRRYEATEVAGQLAGSHIAHAEVNALAQLSSQRYWHDAALLTTLEPCAMCHGAAIQASVARVFFAGRDPYGGTAGMRFGSPQARRRELIIDGPLPGVLGALAEMLHIAFMVQRGTAHVVAAQRAAIPQLTCYTEHVSSRLSEAIEKDDYQSALGLAAQAPRDGRGPGSLAVAHNPNSQ